MADTATTDAWFDNENASLDACWHPVARSVDLTDDPMSIELMGRHWCLVRLGGELTAFPDACPHRMSPLSAGTVVGDTLRCAYHGYRFQADGTCVEIPAVDPKLPIPSRAHCQPATVSELLGLIWLAPTDPITPLPQVLEHDDPAFVNCPLPPADWNASAAQMSDNFLDVGHFPYLHLSTFGEESDKVVGNYSVERDGWHFRAVHRHLSKALAGRVDPSEEDGVDERELQFVYTAPHHVYLRILWPGGVILTVSFCHQPVNASTTRLYCTLYRNDIPDQDEARADAIKFQLAVAAEDKMFLERIHTKAIPLSANAEYHSRADRITLEMRRTLADLVTETGR